MEFDAISNYIVYLENTLRKTHEPTETLELLKLLKTAKRLEKKTK